MARTLIEAALTTRNARSKLDQGLHWRGIDPDIHLGYRRGARGGRWLVRWRVGSAYRQETLATADDVLDADGATTLSFQQAINAARRFVAGWRAEVVAQTSKPLPTVRSIVDDYLRERESRERIRVGEGGSLKRDSRSRLTRYVLSSSELADKPLGSLTQHDLASWLAGLPATLRESTKGRLTSDLRAALNASSRLNVSNLPPDYERTIRVGLHATRGVTAGARSIQILSDDQVRALIGASRVIDERDGWRGGLALLVIVLAATGARFSQVARMTVRDVQSDRGRVFVPTSHKGSSSKTVARTAIPVGPDVLAALEPAVRARAAADALLERPRWKQLTPTKWTEVGVASWRSASELGRPWRKILAEAGFPTDIVPYALRHSSIVRGLRVGLPTRLVAASHDTSSAMIERHYSAHIVSALEALSARSIIPLAS